MTRDYSISLIRVLACFFIILTHLGDHVFNSSIMSQSFNIGVTIFFLISGYLYSNKSIKNEKIWLTNRLIRIYMPLLATTIVMLFLYKINYLFIYNFLNLQGIYRFVDFIHIKTLVHPWFLTVIMVCYLLLVPTKKIEAKYNIFGKFSFIVLFFIVVVCLVYCKIKIIDIFIFFVGYYIGKQNIGLKFLKNYWVFILGFIMLSALRIVCKKLFDDTILYTGVLVPTIKILSSLCFIFLIKSLDILYKQFHNFCASKFIYFFDIISVYVYVMHSFFINEISVFKYGLNLYVSLIIFFMIVIVFSYISYLIFEKLGDIIRNKILTMFSN